MLNPQLSVQTAVLSAFPWLTASEGREVTDALQAARIDTVSATAQMQRYGEVLDNMGLRVATPLLMAVCGRGSKTAAVEVVRNISRHRFDQARAGDQTHYVQAKLMQAPVAPFDVGNVPELIREAAVQVLSGIAMTEKPEAQSGVPKALTEVLKEVRSDLQYLSGEMRWLKTTVDTERQLRRHLEQHGALTESSAPVPANQELARREVIQSLSTSLARSYGSGCVKGESVDKSEWDPLDL